MEDKEKHKRITPQGAWGCALIMLTNGKDKLSAESPDPRNLNTENNAGPKDQTTSTKDPLFRSPTEKNLIAVTK